MEEEFKFREVINPNVVKKISADIFTVWNEFDQHNFEKSIIPKLDVLSLMDRVNLVKEAFYNFLPKDYPTTLSILIASFGAELGSNDDDSLNGLDVFYYMPHSHFIAKYGLEEKHFEISINALYEVTKRFTAEFSIRPFLEKYEEKTLAKLQEWVFDDNLHVRRLVSEGSRPRLPLGSRLKAFQKDPSPVIALLKQLKNDSSLYVRRSVANNLNDIGKDNPDVVTNLLKEWKKDATENTLWMIQHAVRSLVKAGNKEALEILGYSAEINISLQNIEIITEKVHLEQDCFFEMSIESHEDQDLMIDYAIHFMKANGKQRPKIFKWTKKKVKKGEIIFLKKKQSFKKLSTRTYYAGKHSIEIFINGTSYGIKDFEVFP